MLTRSHLDKPPTKENITGLKSTDSPVFVTTKLSGLTDGKIPYHVNDSTGLADGPTKTDVDDAVNKKHAQQHAITSTSDHTSTATSGQILKADTNGLPVDATNTDADVASAVSLKHAALTIDGTSPLSLSGQAISLKNDAAAAITEVDTADTPENSATKIPSSKQLYDHNAAVLSSTIHPNTTLAHLYLNVEQTDMLSGITQRIMLDTAGVDLASGFHNEYLYGAAGVYRQSDAGSNSNTLADADANFVAAQLYRSRIAWASNAAGTLNTGIGYVNSVDSSGSCTIMKLSGADLAANYYYAIKAAHYVVPVTGYYLLFGSVYFKDTVDQKFYGSIIFKNTTPISGNYVHASGTSLLIVPTFIFASLTAGDIISLAENNSSGVNTTDIMNYSAYTFLDIVFLRGA